jgi:hypothetical protein
LWELEQPASAAANGVFIGAINRVGKEEPWAAKMGEFYGSSYIVNPRGQIEAQASYDKDELLVHEIDLDMIRQVRDTWQFFRDRRPETYGSLVTVDGGPARDEPRDTRRRFLRARGMRRSRGESSFQRRHCADQGIAAHLEFVAHRRAVGRHGDLRTDVHVGRGVDHLLRACRWAKRCGQCSSPTSSFSYR